jgi:hypothetical protein
MAAPVKNPSTRTEIIGFPDGTTITGIVREGYEQDSFADIEEVRDEDNSTGLEVISNPGEIRMISGHVQSTFTRPKKGTVITIGGVKWMIHSCKVSAARTLSRISMEVRKPDSITYT